MKEDLEEFPGVISPSNTPLSSSSARRLQLLNRHLAAPEALTTYSQGALVEVEETFGVAWLYFSSAVRTFFKLRSVDGVPGFSISNLFEEQVAKYGKKPALLYENFSLTYEEVNQQANQIAYWARRQGITVGSVVSLVMENRPEFIITWLGLAKLGAVTAFINYRLHGTSLKHVIDISNASLFIVGSEQLENFFSVYTPTKNNVYVFQGKCGRPIPSLPGGQVAQVLDEQLNPQENSNPPMKWRETLKLDDVLWYIYTSGTTGLPKAAKVTHKNVLNRCTIVNHMAEVTENDIIYCCLPLYHSSGSVITLIMWHVGGAIALRSNFSTKEFWNDCRKFNATIFIYIGEICRYLLLQPEQPNDKTHKVRLGIGNGLRPEVWAPFQKRFNIAKIIEFYASTEGNSIINLANKVGAVGYLPWLFGLVANSNVIVKYDVEKEEYVRDKNGFCVQVKPGEVGELLSKIETEAKGAVSSGGQFSGYTDPKATQKKILRDVFEKGDQYFRTGDLLKKDADGFYYFVDRIGDTFRWKGENVSTTEVAEVLTTFPALSEATVYGVAVPGYEGRAGMACVVPHQAASTNWSELYAHVGKQLPQYAQPLFIRVTQEMQRTSTFKYTKTDLIKQGFDPSQIKEPLYYRNDAQKTFLPLTASAYQQVLKGEIRL